MKPKCHTMVACQRTRKGETYCRRYHRTLFLLLLACEHLQLFLLNFPQYHKNEPQLIFNTEVTYNVTFVWKITTKKRDSNVYLQILVEKLFVVSPKSFCKFGELFLSPLHSYLMYYIVLSQCVSCDNQDGFSYICTSPNICLQYRYFQDNLHKVNIFSSSSNSGKDFSG